MDHTKLYFGLARSPNHYAAPIVRLGEFCGRAGRLRSRSSLNLASVFLLLFSGCGAGPLSGDDEAGESDGDESSGSESSSSESSSSESSSSESSSSESSSTGDPLECPTPEPVTARFAVSPPDPLLSTCTVIEELYDGDLYELTLDCAGQAVTVNLDSTILRKPSAGDTVELDYRIEAIGPNQNRWLAIHQTVDQQALVLGGVAASHLDPPGTTLAEFFADPVLSVADEQPCEATMDSCGELVRLALGVSTELFGPANPVFDHGSWYADFLAFGYAIEVEEAIRRVPPVDCDDAPEQYFQLLAVWFPSD